MWLILLYGSKVWTLNTKTKWTPQAAEICFYCRMLKIPWTAQETNNLVLQQVQQECILLQTIEVWQKKFLGHIIRKQKLERRCIHGSKARGRQQTILALPFKPRQLWDTAWQSRTFAHGCITHSTSDNEITNIPRIIFSTPYFKDECKKIYFKR